MGKQYYQEANRYYSIFLNVPQLIRASTIYGLTVGMSIFFRYQGGVVQASKIEEADHLKREIAESQQSTSLINFVQSGQLPLPSFPTDIQVQGTTAFITTQSAGMLIVDLSNSTDPTLVGSYNTSYSLGGAVYPIYDIEMLNNFAYLAEDIGGLRIVDISNISKPVSVGSYFTGWPVRQVATIGDVTWLIDASSSHNIAMLNTSIPSQVQRSGIGLYLSNNLYTGAVSQVVANSSIAYVVAQYASYLIDISEPMMPRVLSVLQRPNGGFWFVTGCIQNNLLVALSRDSAYFFDISTPQDPQLRGIYINQSFYNPYSVSISGDMVYAVGQAGMEIIQVANSSNPGFVNLYNPGGYGSVYDIYLAGSIAYLGVSTGLQIINISNPYKISLIGTYATLNAVNAIGAAGHIVYISQATALSSLYFLDVSNLNNPQLVGSYPFGCSGIYSNNNFLYMIGPSGFRVLNVSNLTSPRVLSVYNVIANQFIVQGNIAYLAGGNGLSIIDTTLPETNLLGLFNYRAGSQIVDIHTVNNGFMMIDSNFDLTWINPRSVGAYKVLLPAAARSINLSGDTVYVGETNGLQIFNFSNINQPQLIGQLAIVTTLSPYGMSVYDNIAYFCYSPSVINVTNPTTPQALSSILGVGLIISIIVPTSTFAFIGTSNSFYIFNVTDPSAPLPLGKFVSSGNVVAISFVDPLIYLIDNSGLVILNVNNSSNPQRIGSTPLTRAVSLYLSNGLAFVVTNTLNIFDVSDPKNPILITNYQCSDFFNPTPSQPIQLQFVTVDNGVAYLLGSAFLENSGLAIVDISNPGKPKLLGSYTGPFLASDSNGITTYAEKNSEVWIGDVHKNLYMISKAPLWDARLALNVIPHTMAIGNNNISYVIDSTNVLHVVSAQNLPDLSELAAGYPCAASAQYMLVVDDFLYAAEGSAGVEVIDIYYPTSPKYLLQLSGLTDVQGLALKDSELLVIDGTAGLVIYDIVGQPLLVNNQFTLMPGATVMITSAQLSARDTTVGVDPMQLEFIIADLQNGYFAFSSQPSVAITRFTQQDIIDGNIEFLTVSGHLLPSFSISVSDGTLTSIPQNASIIFNVTLPPVIVNNYLWINQRETVFLTLNNLSASSYSIAASQLRFTIKQIANGRFENVSNPGVIITHFLQQDIVAGQILFVQTGGSVPSYQVIASDGYLSSVPSFATVNFDASPVLVINQLALNQGATVVFSPANLEAYDIDNNNSTLLFYISQIQYGRFSEVNFTQQSLVDGDVQFTQDGSTHAPVYFVSVSDGRIITPPEQAVTSLTQPGTNNVVVIAGGVVAGGIGVAALIAGSLWYRKRAQDAKTRNAYPIADAVREALKLRGIDNFDSEKGQRFLAVVKKLEQEFASQNLPLDGYDVSELKNIADLIAKSARNKITASTTFFGYSEITLEDLDNKIQAIVREVITLRSDQNQIEARAEL